MRSTPVRDLPAQPRLQPLRSHPDNRADQLQSSDGDLELFPNHFRDQGKHGARTDRKSRHSQQKGIMNLRPVLRQNGNGSILMITVCLSFIIGIVLVSCLSLVKSQNQAVALSQAWTVCMPVMEAGIEEAMAHLNNQ